MRAGRDAVDRDAVAHELHRGDHGERGDAGLGGAVVGLADVAVDARRRAVLMMRRVERLAGLGLLAPVADA